MIGYFRFKLHTALDGMFFFQMMLSSYRSVIPNFLRVFPVFIFLKIRIFVDFQNFGTMNGKDLLISNCIQSCFPLP